MERCEANKRLRIGLSTPNAITAATAFIPAAIQKTSSQPPVFAVRTLVKGTRRDAVPLAVYKAPALAVANFVPKLSVQVEGNKL